MRKVRGYRNRRATGEDHLVPLCANIMLNELDHELLKRGHRFVRYADDMVILCRSKASARTDTGTHPPVHRAGNYSSK